MSERWIGVARPKENPNQKPETIDAATREEVEEWARKNNWVALNYEVKIYPKPS